MSLGNLIILARLDRLTMAIGEDSFGEVLADTARAIGDAEHVMIFAFSPRQPPRAVVSVGAVPRAIADRYAESLYLLDPNYPEVRSYRSNTAHWFTFDGGGYGDTLREKFLLDGGISDVGAFVVCEDSVSYYVLLLRTGGRVFAAAQHWLFRQVGELIAASVRKHFSYMHALRGQNQFLMSRVLADSPAFAGITPRERLVCIGILTGHTSESIALNLSISINSVLTYRKRLYEKLEISSQNELFVLVIAALMDLGQGDAGGQANGTGSGDPVIDAIQREAYLAEAFLA